MALQVWLPLNKDERNCGLATGLPTNSGATFTDSNVFGKVAAFNGSTNYIRVPNGIPNSSKEFTVAAFVKFTNVSATQCIYSQRTGVGIGLSVFLISGKIRFDGGRNDNSGEWSTSKAFTANVWTHVGVSIKNGVKKLYINGMFQESATTTMTTTTGLGVMAVAGASVSSDNGFATGNYLNGQMCDLRVYDNCLTDEDIARLYKHKIFDVNTDVYIKGDTVNYAHHTNTEAAVGWGSYGFGSKGKISRVDISTPFYGYPIKILASGGTGNFAAEAARWVTASPLSKGEKITFSYYAKGVGTTIGKSTQAHIYNNSGSTTVSTGTNGLLTADWKRYSHTLTWTGSTLSSPSFSIYCVGTSFVQDEYFYACNFQLELGDKATNYIPALGISELPVDMSGYAPPFSTTNVIKSGGTIYFDGTSSIISTQLDFGRLFDSNYAFSFWVNSEDATSSRSIYFGCGGQGNGWTLSLERLSSSLIFRAWNDQKPDYTESNFKINNNEWTHVGFVKSGTTVYSYKNGALVGSKAGFSAHTLFDRTYYLGGDYRMGDILYKGYLGDFKIYANAFTSAEMLGLYNKEKIKYQ